MPFYDIISFNAKDKTFISEKPQVMLTKLHFRGRDVL